MMAVSRVDEGWQSLATDFLHGHVITASQAHYLVLSDLTICCSPSVLAFAKKEEAIKFQVGFGGRILDFHLALDFVTHGVLPS